MPLPLVIAGEPIATASPSKELILPGKIETRSTAAPFLAELSDYRNFSSYKKILAFAGLDPTIHQSGKFEGMSMISRRGNRYLGGSYTT